MLLSAALHMLRSRTRYGVRHCTRYGVRLCTHRTPLRSAALHTLRFAPLLTRAIAHALRFRVSQKQYRPEDLASFEEIYACQGQRGASKYKQLLSKVRSNAQVTARIAELADSLKLPPELLTAASTRDRLVFCGRYSAKAGTPLDEALAAAAQGIQEAAQVKQTCATAGVSGESGGKLPFAVLAGTFGDVHLSCRGAAFPYRPSVSASHGSSVLEAKATQAVPGVAAAGAVLGYVAMQGGGYVDDIAVFPKFHGQGVASGLLAAAAQLELKAARRGGAGASLSLDVRAANVPAIKLYEGLGFEFGQNGFPGFLDWDGGFEGAADATTVLAKLPPNCDLSKL